jgi:hypothetical protein
MRLHVELRARRLHRQGLGRTWVTGESVEWNFFAVLGISPERGRGVSRTRKMFALSFDAVMVTTARPFSAEGQPVIV